MAITLSCLRRASSAVSGTGTPYLYMLRVDATHQQLRIKPEGR